MEDFTTGDVNEVLRSLLEQNEDDDDVKTLLSEVKSVKTFKEAGVLSGNRGLVLTLANGSQFQVTVVQSR